MARRKPKPRPVPRLTPAMAASDLIRIALLTTDVPAEDPVRILADGTTRVLSRTECARALMMLAVIARAFALALPADERAALLLRLEDVLVDETLTRLELDLLEQDAEG